MSSAPSGAAVGRPPSAFRVELDFQVVDRLMKDTGLTPTDVRRTAKESFDLTIRLDRLRRRKRASTEVVYALSAILQHPMQSLLKVATAA